MLKKDKDYLLYFRTHVDKIRDFPEPEDNVENYRKLQKTVLGQIGLQVGV